ncbi:hypothetical protein [Flavobacterium lacus]|jgi:hypothetical protein|uniref:Uncharacterized protein n=1 Tax=Flavobacterium lacus TaxID=1353778 RepID=A0A328X2J7_9FLAO|nr:hypothetical protein [Flavobacterium lacus]RAR50847.1 hypothetical protein B0I10_10112 [Flavobacterium lacus]
MIETATTFFEPIEKETIQSLHFPPVDVLEDKQLKRTRIAGLARALALGNLEHIKTKIYFEDELTKRVVETTIWGITDDKVILKKGTIIPINRIYYSQ